MGHLTSSANHLVQYDENRGRVTKLLRIIVHIRIVVLDTAMPVYRWRGRGFVVGISRDLRIVIGFSRHAFNTALEPLVNPLRVANECRNKPLVKCKCATRGHSYTSWAACDSTITASASCRARHIANVILLCRDRQTPPPPFQKGFGCDSYGRATPKTPEEEGGAKVLDRDSWYAVLTVRRTIRADFVISGHYWHICDALGDCKTYFGGLRVGEAVIRRLSEPIMFGVDLVGLLTVLALHDGGAKSVKKILAMLEVCHFSILEFIQWIWLKLNGMQRSC